MFTILFWFVVFGWSSFAIADWQEHWREIYRFRLGHLWQLLRYSVRYVGAKLSGGKTARLVSLRFLQKGVHLEKVVAETLARGRVWHQSQIQLSPLWQTIQAQRCPQSTHGFHSWQFDFLKMQEMRKLI